MASTAERGNGTPSFVKAKDSFVLPEWCVSCYLLISKSYLKTNINSPPFCLLFFVNLSLNCRFHSNKINKKRADRSLLLSKIYDFSLSDNLRTVILNNIKPINVPYFPVSISVSGATIYSIKNIIIAIETNIRFI